ncbi:hypothetical protein PAECIP111892_04022 [Paenibacillus auburnensis]|uniref:DUF1697 domain-containing protein n=1 Tax=Paenibacillus auburnensis TaxID=2905649 RepID=A0ABN8GP64_9BACL|nr:DUF1697 domain-containing protein [Paenibacillus auburnensis]CAH1214420.1 hypothetical protein PAECIP111892_04022 [Paenibacillus auburnensis]
MPTYIALLRGINVGGHKIIKMQDLKAMFESLGCGNVRTYIQSGNVVFESGEPSEEGLVPIIEKRIRETFGFEVPVILRTAEELESAIKASPFQLETEEDYKRLYVSFLDQAPSAGSLEKLIPYGDGADKLQVVGKELYILYEVSVSQSPLFKVSLDKLLGVQLTARNWNTVNKLAALCRKA